MDTIDLFGHCSHTNKAVNAVLRNVSLAHYTRANQTQARQGSRVWVDTIDLLGHCSHTNEAVNAVLRRVSLALFDIFL